MLTRSTISVIAILITMFGNYIYFKDVFSSKTKPHAFTWLIWAILDFIVFAGQLSGGAGIAAFVTAANGLCALVILILAFRQAEKEIKASDWWSLLGAAVALVLWIVTKNPLASIVLVTLINFLGFLPTIRKSRIKPYEETLIYFVLMGVRSVLTVIALKKFTVVTYLEPTSLIFANFLFAGMLIMRRKFVRTSYAARDSNPEPAD